MNAEDCAKPVWANLFFVDTSGATLWHNTAAFHGLPVVGALVEVMTDAEPFGYFGKVVRVRYGTVPDGSFKPTIVVEAAP